MADLVRLPEEEPTVSSSMIGSALVTIRRRMIAGLLVSLPFIVTIWIVYFLYINLVVFAIDPAARLVVWLVQGQVGDDPLPGWFGTWIAPPLALAIVAAILYLLGFVAKARAVRILDNVLLRLPIITKIHKAVRGVFASLQAHGDISRFQRAVLVAFPHPGMRVPGFVTSSCRDEITQRTILCVYVPTTPVPTSGYMLLIPEDQVTDLEWSLEETIQAVVSFGITAPMNVRYFSEVPLGGSNGPDGSEVGPAVPGESAGN